MYKITTDPSYPNKYVGDFSVMKLIPFQLL